MIRYVPVDNLQCFTSHMLQVCDAQDNWCVQNQNFAALNFGGYCTAFSLSATLEQKKPKAQYLGIFASLQLFFFTDKKMIGQCITKHCFLIGDS